MKIMKSDLKIVILIGFAIAAFIGVNLCLWATSNASQISGSSNGHAEAGGNEYGGQSIGGGWREWSQERGNFRNVVLGRDENCDYDSDGYRWLASDVSKAEVCAENGYIDWLQNDKRPESHDYYYMSELSFWNFHFCYGRHVIDEGGKNHDDSIGITYCKESAGYSGVNSFKLFFKMICKKADGSGDEIVYGWDDFDDKYDLSDNGESLGGLLHREAEGEPEALDTPIEKIKHITGQDDILEAIHNGSVTFVLYKIQAHH